MAGRLDYHHPINGGCAGPRSCSGGYNTSLAAVTKNLMLQHHSLTFCTCFSTPPQMAHAQLLHLRQVVSANLCTCPALPHLYVLLQSSREELIEDIEALKKRVGGTD